MNATDFRSTPLSLQSMGTYSSWPADFDEFMTAGIANPGVANFGVGLNTAPNKAPHMIPRAEIQRRFKAIQAAGILEVDIFRLGPFGYGENLLNGGWMEALATWRSAPLLVLQQNTDPVGLKIDDEAIGATRWGQKEFAISAWQPTYVPLGELDARFAERESATKKSSYSHLLKERLPAPVNDPVGLKTDDSALLSTAPPAWPSPAVSFWYSPIGPTYGPWEPDWTNMLKKVEAHKHTITSVILFCGISVAPGGAVGGNVSAACANTIIPGLLKIGVRVEICLESGTSDVKDYRLLFARDPQPLASRMVAIGTKHRLSGWNMDLEPQKGAPSSTKADAVLYSAWAAKVAPTLHAAGMRFTADVGCCGAGLVEYATLAKGFDRVMDMVTYNSASLTSWLGPLHRFTTTVPTLAQSVGLGAWISSVTNATSAPEHWSITPASATERICHIMNASVPEVSVYVLSGAPATDPEEFWWAQLDKYIGGEGCIPPPLPANETCPSTLPNFHRCNPGELYCLTPCCAASFSPTCGEECAEAACNRTKHWHWQLFQNYSQHLYTCCPDQQAEQVQLDSDDTEVANEYETNNGQNAESQPLALRHKTDDGSTCHKCPHRSDVVLSSRWARYDPVNGLDTMTAIEAFHSTRLDWVYTTNASFVKQVHQRVATLTASMNPQCPDHPGRNATFNIGRVLNVHGQPLTDPAMRSWKNPASFGCINHPGYLKIAFDFADNLIRIGADAIQHDDSGANGEAVSWSGGDPTLSGCYCEHCMAGFRDALTQLNKTTQTRLNVSADFNYREMLLQAHQSSSQMEELRNLFVEFQANSTKTYVRKLRVHVDATAATLGRPPVTLSCNNGGYWTTPAVPSLLFDYGMGELNALDATPEGLDTILTWGLPAGKQQVLTMPKTENETLTYSLAFTALIRASIAYTYASGAQMMVPWDVYDPGRTDPGARYYGNVSQFGDIYQFVRAHASLLDETVHSSDTLPRKSQGRYELAHSGAHGDNRRWQWPYPFTPPSARGARIGGARGAVGEGLAACAAMCDRDPHCKGIYFNSVNASWGPSTVCYALQSLVECETTLTGNSYVRQQSSYAEDDISAPLEPVAVISDPQVHARTRRSVDNAAVAIHLVNWRATKNVWGSGEVPGLLQPITVNLSNAMFDLRGGCGAINVMLHQLGGGANSTVKVACTNGDNVTVLSLPAPDPWAIVEVRPISVHPRVPPMKTDEESNKLEVHRIVAARNKEDGAVEVFANPHWPKCCTDAIPSNLPCLFRIPVVLKVGLSTVLAFAEGRPGAIVPGRGCDDGTGRSVWMRRSTDGGRHWGKHRRIVNDTDPWHAALQDGVQMGAALYDNVTKTTFVFYTTCTHQCKMRNISASSLFITSKNDGVTWSEPTNITTIFTVEGMYMMAFGQGLGVQFPQTTTAPGLLMLCGWFDVFTTYITHDPTKSGVVCIGSVDSGTSWRVRGTLVGPHAGSEVGLALLKNGSVLLDMRSSDGSRARIQSRTDDGGLVAPASLHHM
jgi:hypothetical protein